MFKKYDIRCFEIQISYLTFLLIFFLPIFEDICDYAFVLTSKNCTDIVDQTMVPWESLKFSEKCHFCDLSCKSLATKLWHNLQKIFIRIITKTKDWPFIEFAKVPQYHCLESVKESKSQSDFARGVFPIALSWKWVCMSITAIYWHSLYCDSFIHWYVCMYVYYFAPGHTNRLTVITCK